MGEPTTDYSEEDRLALAQASLSLLSDWGLNSEQQMVMLGLDASHPISLDVVMRGAPLPVDDDVLERAGHFLNISLALNAIHDYDASQLNNWMMLGNELLGGQTPFSFVSEYGTTGLAWLDDLLGQKQADLGSLEYALGTAS